jgi:hypothetical protein
VKRKAAFIEPMLLLRSVELPDGPEWVRELKFDGYRAVAVKSEGRVRLRSRNDNDFSSRYPAIARALEALPDETVIDGEIVALDAAGRPSFNALQNGLSRANIIYYVFDLILLAGTDVSGETLESRRALLEHEVLPKLSFTTALTFITFMNASDFAVLVGVALIALLSLISHSGWSAIQRPLYAIQRAGISANRKTAATIGVIMIAIGLGLIPTTEGLKKLFGL